jgi:hypothetical protein
MIPTTWKPPPQTGRRAFGPRFDTRTFSSGRKARDTRAGVFMQSSGFGTTLAGAGVLADADPMRRVMASANGTIMSLVMRGSMHLRPDDLTHPVGRGKNASMSATEQTEPRMVTFKMSVDDHAELERLAKSRERTLSAELRLAVKAYLANARTLQS